jgi:valyl-tRNA synthetase
LPAGVSPDAGGGALAVVAGRIEAVVRSETAADPETAEREKARLDKELAEAERLLEAARARLADPRFVERAPAQVVDGARARVGELEERVTRLRGHRAALG